MSGESSYGSITSIVNNVWEIALLTAREYGIMQNLVTVYGDMNGSGGRAWATYAGGTVQTVAETMDLGTATQAFTPSAAGTFTPTQYGLQYFITDQRIASDPFGVQRDAGQDIASLLAKKVDGDLVALFSTLTAGTVGSSGGTITWGDIQKASAKLRAQLAPPPYYCVLHPMQWYYLTSASSGVPTLLQSQELMNRFGGFYQASWAGIDFMVDANITASATTPGALFSRQAMVYDVRRPLRIEVQRDASRGGGGWELNATQIYAVGLFRSAFGCMIQGTAA